MELKGKAPKKTGSGVKPKKVNSFACLIVNVTPDGRPVRLNVALLMACSFGFRFYKFLGERSPGPRGF